MPRSSWRLKKNMSAKKPLLSKPFEKFWLLNTDISPLLRPHSPTLPQRRYVYKPNNQVKGNKPVEVGYEMSCVGLSARRPLYGAAEPPWNLPLSMRLVPFEENKNSFTARQVNDVVENEAFPFHKELTVNTLDSNYSHPEYIVDTHVQPNLVNVARLASNRKVWKMLGRAEREERREENKDRRGANAVFGQELHLNKPEEWAGLPPDQAERFCVKLSNGKRCEVEVSVWEEMLLRSKRGKNMKNKPFRLVKIRLLDAQTGQALFKKEMWLGVWGDRRMELSGEEIYFAYRNRYDIEHFFRFGKQRLLLDDYQTPEEEHLENWLEVVSLAYWMLWSAVEEAAYQCPKWQKYDKNLKKRRENKLPPSPSEVQRQLQSIILSFEQSPFLPKLQIKGKGRAQGQTFIKRERHPVLKKKKKRPCIKK